MRLSAHEVFRPAGRRPYRRGGVTRCPSVCAVAVGALFSFMICHSNEIGIYAGFCAISANVLMPSVGRHTACHRFCESQPRT